MHVIGLTGGIASGKSTVSRHLAELGAIILDADQVAREIVTPGAPTLHALVVEFGSAIIQEDGSLNRAKLAEIVFHNPQKRQRLDAITHPQIDAVIAQKLSELKEQYRDSKKVVVIDAALLVEAGLNHHVQEVWLVMADVATQLKRIMERDKLSEEAAQARLNSQINPEQRLTYADRVLYNNASQEELLQQVNTLWDQLINEN